MVRKALVIYHISAFYSLTPLDQDTVTHLFTSLKNWDPGQPPLKGMVLIAADGINATLAGSQKTLTDIESWLAQSLSLSTIKRSQTSTPPYRRWKVVRRRETVTSGPMGSGPEQAPHLSPAQWHAMMQRNDVVLIDVRNDYEVNLGTFKKAINPKTHTFTQFSHYVDQLTLPKEQPILTFCTGGIRCEKAAPYLKSKGFNQVYQLDGGILHYLEQYPDGLFEGECFVFDDRIALDQKLQPTQLYHLCENCGQPTLHKQLCSNCYHQ